MKTKIIVLLLYIGSSILMAQTIEFNEDSTTVFITNNRIHLPFDNSGVLADVGFPNTCTYDDIFLLFSGGLFLSGYSDTTLWANGVASSALVKDYLPGIVGSDPNSSKNKIYSVTITDPPFSKSWQNWKDAVDNGAKFYDGDGDGIYSPVDKNNNGQWDANEDKPDLLYDATFYTVYNDGVPKTERRFSDVNPLGIEIGQTIFFSNRNTVLDDVFFVRYSINYKGLGNTSESDSLTNVIYSVWSDVDLGEATDDLVGYDSTLQAGYVYNDSSEDVYFGDSSPAVFRVLLQGPLRKSTIPNSIGYNRMGPDLGIQLFEGYENVKVGAYIHNLGGDPDIRNAISKEELRNYTQGHYWYGGIVDPCSWREGQVKGGINCQEVNTSLWYTGDPIEDSGWLNISGTEQKDLISTEEFTLPKYEPMDIIIAYVVERGTDHLNSIIKARETVKYVHEEYERNFSTLVGVKEEQERIVNNFSLSQNYPNPFNPGTSIKFSIPALAGRLNSQFATLKVYDILGREVATLVNETKPAGIYEVEFDGSNLTSGVYFYALEIGGVRLSKKMMLIK